MTNSTDKHYNIICTDKQHSAVGTDKQYTLMGTDKQCKDCVVFPREARATVR